MKGIGTDERALISVLGNRTYEQIQVIKRAFTQEFQRDLYKDVKSETSGNFGSVARKMCLDKAHLDAKLVRKAIVGVGTAEHVVIDIICTKNRADLVALQQAYQTHFQTTIEKDIRGDFSGDLKKLLLAVLAGNRDDLGHVHDRSEIDRVAQELYAAGEKRWGTNESVFIKYLTSKPPSFLEAVSDCYASKFGHDLVWVINKEFSGDLKEACLALVQPPAHYVANRIHSAMAGAGTNDKRLIRLIVTRRGRDLSMVKHYFLKKHGKTIEQMVKGDTSGDYKEMLLALLRSEPGA